MCIDHDYPCSCLSPWVSNLFFLLSCLYLWNQYTQIWAFQKIFWIFDILVQFDVVLELFHCNTQTFVCSPLLCTSNSPLTWTIETFSETKLWIDIKWCCKIFMKPSLHQQSKITNLLAFPLPTMFTVHVGTFFLGFLFWREKRKRIVMYNSLYFDSFYKWSK